MAPDSLITELPEGYREEGIDVDNWLDQFVFMLDNLKVGEPAIYSVVGIDLDKFLLNKDAFRFLAAQNGVKVRFERSMQVMSLTGLHQAENVELLNPAQLPDTFFELTQGAVVIPMDDSRDAISDDYDAGYPIWTAHMHIVKYEP